MQPLIRRIVLRDLPPAQRGQALNREWLLTNGLGGYASGTLGGVVRRRYHGLLVASLPAPLGRRMIFPHLSERLMTPQGEQVALTAEQRDLDDMQPAGAECLEEFRLENGLPVWRYRIGGALVEKRIVLGHEQNTVLIHYRVIEGRDALRLELRASLHHRSHHDALDAPLPGEPRLIELGNRYELALADLPAIRLAAAGRRQAFTAERAWSQVSYPIEAARGYEHRGSLWTPGHFRIELAPQHSASLTVSTEPWEAMLALSPEELLEAECGRRERRLQAAPPAARQGLAGELTLAADQFLVKPAGRAADVARGHAEGDEVRTVIAGYHWFTDWGRDTMISLEGLTLATGRLREAREILALFAHYTRDGLLPNLFPEGETEGVYHTADATLWFVHALHRYVEASGDAAMVDLLLPKLIDIASRHLRGTRFGIGVDPHDGLLRQGEAGYQLTWMDAKVDDWVVTPRRGKAVEINALWYNALCLLAGWLRERGRHREAEHWARQAAQARASFNRRFWYAAGGYLYDVVDGEQGDDPACRPNQVLALSLTHPVLDPHCWEAVLDAVRARLLTPFGLRTLSPDHPDYRARYDGDLRSRDAAYHQGTVWPWLIGPFVDAWLRVHPGDAATARGFLAAFDAHLSVDCVGSISEIFDAEPPYTPRGCIAQAWSVAEVLRGWLKTQG